jgi:hypothetical protein
MQRLEVRGSVLGGRFIPNYGPSEASQSSVCLVFPFGAAGRANHVQRLAVRDEGRTRRTFIIFPCSAVSPHLAALAALSRGSGYTIRARQRTRHMTSESRFIASNTCNVARLPRPHSALAAFCLVAGTLGHAATI